MSSRAAEALREDLESRGPVRLSEVETQQKDILKVVRRLSDEGQIVLGGGGDEPSSKPSPIPASCRGRRSKGVSAWRFHRGRHEDLVPLEDAGPAPVIDEAGRCKRLRRGLREGLPTATTPGARKCARRWRL
jgi:hypothetical protein